MGSLNVASLGEGDAFSRPSATEEGTTVSQTIIDNEPPTAPSVDSSVASAPPTDTAASPVSSDSASIVSSDSASTVSSDSGADAAGSLVAAGSSPTDSASSDTSVATTGVN